MSKIGLGVAFPLELHPSDLRDAFFDQVNETASSDSRLMVLTDDQGALSLEWLQNNFPKQYCNIGVAEQNQITIATGLALAGKIPFVYGIATFMAMRCFEQIRDDLCCMNLPVTIVVSGGGFTYGADGPTHHATQDLAIMRTLPEMTIFNPSDAVSTRRFAEISYASPGPKYIRIERGTLGRIYEDDHDFSSGMDLLIDGADILILSTGTMVHTALEAASKLRVLGIAAGVVDIYRLKPINSENLIDMIAGTERVITLEEHSIVGGLGSLVSEVLSDAGITKPLKRMAIPDKSIYSYGSREWLQRLAGLDTATIVKEVIEWCGSKSS